MSFRHSRWLLIQQPQGSLQNSAMTTIDQRARAGGGYDSEPRTDARDLVPISVRIHT